MVATHRWPLLYAGLNSSGCDHPRIKQPYTCPVCRGTRLVEDDFYNSGMSTTEVVRSTCRSCNGTGVVWG